MKLSGELLTQFAKITNDTAKPEKSSTVYGTAIELDGTMYVRMDGSELLTPASATTDMKNGDRVTITIKDHTAIATGNISSPAARTGDVQTINSTVNAQGSQIDIIGSTVTTLNSNFTVLDSKVRVQDSKISTIESEIETQDSKISTIESTVQTQGSSISTIESKIQTQDSKISTIESTVQTQGSSISTIESEIETQDSKISTIESTVQTQGSTITNIGSTIQNQNTTISNLDSAIETQGANIEIINSAFKIEDGKVTGLDTVVVNELKTNTLDAGYAKIDMANVNNAWIENGVIKDAAITNEKVLSVSANKLTAGTIDASKITVTNLNADNLTVGTINGQRIGNGSIDLDKLSEEVPTKEYLDSLADNLQDQIDGAIETWTSDDIPTLNNYPASNWTDNDMKRTHVGDVLYVVNAASSSDGYCYRFTESQDNTFSWTLIKDSDVTKALQDLIDAQGDISGLKSFKTEMSSWKTDTEEEIGNIQIRTTSLETNLGGKVDTTVFNEVKQAVDENTASITSLTETTTGLSNTVNVVQQTSNANSASITSLTQTVEGNKTTIESRASNIEQDISGFKATVSSTYSTKDEAQGYADDAEEAANAYTETAALQIASDQIKSMTFNGTNGTTASQSADGFTWTLDSTGASQTATNYMSFDISDGLVVGDMTSDSLGGNVKIESNGVKVRNGDTVLAEYGSTTRIGNASGTNVVVDSDSVDIKNGTKLLASYGDSVSLYSNGSEVFNISVYNEIQEALKDIPDGQAFMTNSSYPSIIYVDTDEFDTITYGPGNHIFALVWGLFTSNFKTRYCMFHLDSEMEINNFQYNPIGNVLTLYGTAMNLTSGINVPCTLLDPDDISRMLVKGSIVINNSRDIIDDDGDFSNMAPFIITDGDEGSSVAMSSKKIILEDIANNDEYFGFMLGDGLNSGYVATHSKNLGYIAENSNTGTEVAFGVGAGGINRGVFDSSNNKWMLYCDANNLYLGAPSVSGNFRPYYKKGDELTIEIPTAGYVTHSKEQIWFTVPLDRPVIGNPTVTASSTDGIILRQNNSYTHGSTSTTYATVSSYSATLCPGFVKIVATLNDTANATNNSPIGVAWHGKIKFS